jgi:hypothetical protein
MSKRILVLCMFVLALFICESAELALAHEPEYVHPGLTDKAAQLLPQSCWEPKTYVMSMKSGASGEDAGVRCRNHFYNMSTTAHGLDMPGFPIFDDAVLWCTSTSDRSWSVAIQTYDYTPAAQQDAYHYLGQCVHLLQDMSVPAHVQNDIHLPLRGNDIFETFCRNNYTSLPSGTGVTTVSDIGDAMLALNGVARACSSFNAHLRRANPQLDDVNGSHNDFKDMFPSIYYDSSGLNESWEIPQDRNGARVGSFFPSSLRNSDWWPCVGLPQVGTTQCYVENSSAVPFYYNGTENTASYSLCTVYFGLMIDPAIDSSAGVMKLYHEIVNHPPFVRRVKVTQDAEVRYDGLWVDDVQSNRVHARDNETSCCEE